VNGPARLRIGLPAILFDLLVAVAALVLSYRLRFEAGEAQLFLAVAALPLGLMVLLQIGVGALAGLYRTSGQVMWPVRMAIGAVAGAVLGMAAAFALGQGDGVSRQAVASQIALYGLGASLWRSAVGLQVRRRRRRELAALYGTEDLVVQGEDLASMAGGIARVGAYWHLLRNLVARDLHIKYRRSALGFAWSILTPLLTIGVYALAFTYVMPMGTPKFVLYLLIGLLAWNFFAGAISGSTGAISESGSLLKSVVFPRAVLPFAVVLFHLIQYLLTLAVFLPMMLLIYQVPPSPRMLLFPFFLVLNVVFITGLALGLSAATALFRDVRHLVDVGVGMLFWATPIIYEMSRVPEPVQFLALLMPATPFIRAYQDIFFYEVVPDPTIWVVSIVYALGAFVCGLSVFLAFESRFSELV
jgi:ABC-type polysaccharide/polyol phosphate export permease